MTTRATENVGLVEYNGFEYDPNTTTGLTFGYSSGDFFFGGMNNIPAGTVVLSASSTNLVYIDFASGIQISATTTGNLPSRAASVLLYVVETDASGITSIGDYRNWLTGSTIDEGAVQPVPAALADLISGMDAVLFYNVEGESTISNTGSSDAEDLGSYVDGSITQVSSPIGNAAEFDDACYGGAYSLYPNFQSALEGLGSTGCVAIGFKQDGGAANTDYLFVTLNDSGFQSFKVEWRSNGSLSCEMFRSLASDGWNFNTVTTGLDDNQWHMILIVQDGTTGEPICYIDGVDDNVSVGNSTTDLWFGDLWAGTDPTRFGIGSNLATNYTTPLQGMVNGQIDFIGWGTATPDSSEAAQLWTDWGA